MTRPRIFILVVVAILTVGAIIYFITPKEPSYHGRRLSAWLNEYYTARHYDIPNRHAIMRTSEQAIKKIGTNAIPMLLNWLQTTNSTVKVRLNRLLARQHFIRFRFDLLSAGVQNDKGMAGFEILAGDAMPAVPVLTNLLNCPDQNQREQAFDCLLYIDNGTRVLFPFVIQSLNSTNSYFQDVAAIYLIQTYPDEAEKAGVYKMFPQLKPSSAKKDEANPPPTK